MIRNDDELIAAKERLLRLATIIDQLHGSPTADDSLRRYEREMQRMQGEIARYLAQNRTASSV
jgi:hypothetical protein